jgi:hypothetical protein
MPIIKPEKGMQGQAHYLGDIVILGTDREILFSGQHGVVVAPGETIVSDPVDFETGDRGLMAVSLYLPNKTEPATWVRNAVTAYVFQGDLYDVARGIPVPQNRGPAFGIFWLSSVEVLLQR